MAIAVNMPQVGQDVETATITEWCVKENDSVQKGDIIAVVDSDKASFEVEAYESGTVIKLLYKEGEVVHVLQPIAYIGNPGEEIREDVTTFRSDRPTSSESMEPPISEPSGKTTGKRILATPAVKRIAREHNVNIADIRGSGPDGRILKDDVFNYVENLSHTTKDGPVEAERRPSSSTPNAGVLIEFSKMRQTIANRMVKSKQQIPHFYLFTEADITELLLQQAAFNESRTEENKISLNDLLIQAVAKALRQHPQLNAYVSSEGMIRKNDINIGIAVSVDNGLFVPVLEKADEKDIETIHLECRELIMGARKGKMKPTSAGTFTISNLGMYPVNAFVPIINPPEAAILGVGRTVKRVVPVANHEIAVRDIITMSLACDHRAADGTTGARFLEELKNDLEQIKN